MFGIILAGILPVILYLVVQGTEEQPTRSKVMALLLGGYFLRMILQAFVRDLPLFSHGGGGDCEGYERMAATIAQIWQYTGLEYITNEQIPDMGPTSLPPNLFALVMFFNGGITRIGCTSLIAVTASLTCFNVYRLAIELGSDREITFKVLVLTLFSPAFLLYTSDMFKDGLVLFFVVGALGSAFRLSRKFTVLHAVVGLVSLVALWHVRFYLIYVTVAPLLVGVVGTSARSRARTMMLGLGLGIALLALAAYTNAIQNVSGAAGVTFDHSTSEAVVGDNARGGSGVVFNDGGSPFGALWLKVIYTLFAPFPWQGGSIGLQIGKIEVMIWYYLAYRAWLAGRQMWKEDKARLFMFLAFLAPTTVLYATIMSNVGLIMRERMPIVMMATLLATQSWAGRKKESSEGEPEEETELAPATEA